MIYFVLHEKLRQMIINEQLMLNLNNNSPSIQRKPYLIIELMDMLLLGYTIGILVVLYIF